MNAREEFYKLFGTQFPSLFPLSVIHDFSTSDIYQIYKAEAFTDTGILRHVYLILKDKRILHIFKNISDIEMFKQQLGRHNELPYWGL